MLHLPYLCEPGDDEILGSWLARLCLHMGRGAWIVLSRMAGYGRRIERSFFAMADFSEKFTALLDILETTYEEVVMQLTLLPYWLAFEAAYPSAGTLPGTANLPRVAGVGEYGRRFLRSASPRWCPICLESDLSEVGEPYWHRAHQLPNVFVCCKHRCALRTSCPKCGRTVRSGAKHLMPLPALRCECGYDLRTNPDFPSMSGPYRRLLEISRQALEIDIPRWSCDGVREFVRSLLIAHGESPRVAYRSCLLRAFHLKYRPDQSAFMDSRMDESTGGVAHQGLKLRQEISAMRARLLRSARRPRCNV
jgi:TniQ